VFVTSLRESLGLPLIALDTAEPVGNASGFVIDPATRRIAAVHVGGKKHSARFVSWEDITSFGTDAVMVANEGVVHDSSTPLEARMAEGATDVLDKRTLTEVGDDIGEVTDVEFDAADGRIEQLRVADHWIGRDDLLGIGTYAVVVSSQDPTDA
jgi:uncharacterized protein YrrD